MQLHVCCCFKFVIGWPVGVTALEYIADTAVDDVFVVELSSQNYRK